MKEIAVIWLFDNEWQFELFEMSFKICFSRNKNLINYYVYIPSEKKDIIKLFKKLNENFENVISLIEEDSHKKIFSRNDFEENLMVLETIVPFWLKEKYIIFMDNDTLPFIDVTKIIENKKIDIENISNTRRYWNIKTASSKINFIERNYPNNSISKLKKINGSGGVVLYNASKYREIFDNSKDKYLEKLEEYILFEKDSQLHQLAEGKSVFLDDEVFLNAHTQETCNSNLPLSYNCTLNFGIDKLNKTINSENFIIHLADNPKGLKKLLYRRIILKKEIYYNEIEHIIDEFVKTGYKNLKNRKKIDMFISKLIHLLNEF